MQTHPVAALYGHIQEVQDKATRLEALVEAIKLLAEDERGRLVIDALSEIALENATAIQVDLDDVNLPKVEIHA